MAGILWMATLVHGGPAVTRWNLNIQDETDRMVRSHLARSGLQEGDLSKFVDDAVRREVLRRTMKEIRAGNADLTPAEAERLANEAVAWARAHPA